MSDTVTLALQGEVTPSGNKNAALPLLAACLLTEEPVVLHNVPQIRETRDRELAFWSAVLISYMGTLAWETILTSRARKTTLEAGPAPAAMKVGE